MCEWNEFGFFPARLRYRDSDLYLFFVFVYTVFLLLGRLLFVLNFFFSAQRERTSVLKVKTDPGLCF